MKLLTQIAILSFVKLGLLQNNQNYIIDQGDKDLSQYDLFHIGFEKASSRNSETAHIPSLEIFNAENLIIPFHPLCIVYNVKFFNESLLDTLFQQVSILQTRKSTWAPLILVKHSTDDVISKPLKVVHDFVQKTNYNWNFPINAGFYIMFNNTNSVDDFSVIEIYNIKNVTIVQKIGIYPEERINYYSFVKKDNRRSDFRKEVMVAVSMDVHGYEVATDFDDDNTTDKFVGGFEVKFYLYLKDALNFTEQALRGKGYVREGPNGTLTGMAAQINKDLADISISSTEFLEYRITGPDGFSYLLPTFKLGMEAYFKQPPASSIRDVFTSGFSLELWVTMLALWIFICLSMHLACLIYFKEDWFKCLDWSDVVMSDEISIWATGAMCQQGWYFTPKCTGTRIIFFFGWFTGFFCYIAYSAQLVSILSVEVVPIKSWDDLIRDEFFIYNDNHIPTTKYFVKGLQQRGIIPTVPEEMRNVDIEKTFEQMIKSKSAMVSISDSLFPILQTMGLSENYICSVLSDVRIGSRTVIMSMFVKRASPTRSIFNFKILQMLERGVNNRILRDYFVTTSVQCLTGGSGFNKPLGGKDVFTAYAILLSGFILSCAILVAEQLFRRMWNSTKLLPNPEPLAAAPLASIMQYNTNGETTSHTNIINYYLNRRKSSNISKNDIKRWAQARF